MTEHESNAAITALQLAVQAAESAEDPSRTVRRAREFYGFLRAPSGEIADLQKIYSGCGTTSPLTGARLGA